MKLFIIVRRFFIVTSILLSPLIFNGCQQKDDSPNGDYPNDSALYFWANIGDSAITNEVYNFKATRLYTSVNDSSLFIGADDGKGQSILIAFKPEKNHGNFPREGVFNFNNNQYQQFGITGGFASYSNMSGAIKDYSTYYDVSWEQPLRDVEFNLNNFDGETIGGQFWMDLPSKDTPQTFISIKCFFNKVRLNMKNEKI